MDYIPSFFTSETSETKTPESDQNFDFSLKESAEPALEKVNFLFQGKEYTGIINQEDFTVSIDLQGKTPDSTIKLNNWTLSSSYKSIEYELKAERKADSIIYKLVVEKMESPIFNYPIIYTIKSDNFG